MSTLQAFTSILALLSFSVQAFPLSLRDVVAPKIIKPDASSIWAVGTQQVVIWDTTGFPAQITNPMAQIILGFDENNSLNLDLDHPLAQNFKLTDGKVTVTVPNVTPRKNYLIVLYGDSGDSSELFAITPITFPVSSASSSSASSSNSIDGATLPLTILSTSSSVAPTSTDSSAAVDTPTVVPPTGTTTTGSTSSSSSSSSSSASSVSNSASALAASPTSAGWSLHRGSSLWNSAAPFLMSVASFVMVFMV